MVNNPRTLAKLGAAGGFLFGIGGAALHGKAPGFVWGVVDVLWLASLCVLIYVAILVVRGRFWSANAVALLTVAFAYGWFVVALNIAALAAVGVVGAILNGVSMMLMIGTALHNRTLFRAVRRVDPSARKDDWAESTTGSKPVAVLNRPKLLGAVDALRTTR